VEACRAGRKNGNGLPKTTGNLCGDGRKKETEGQGLNYCIKIFL
jgi:hypothetical protein